MSERPDPDATGAYVPPTRPAERFATGELLAGRYCIVAPLGKGGMGEVYRADDLTLGQPVALKFLPTHLSHDPGRLSRFRNEVASARRVSHPNVCRVYDIAEHDGQSFLTMEYVDGENLASVLKRLGRPTEEKGAEMARQLCAALAAVHDQGLLHRDLKPANVMVDGRGRVRLTDFGLAAVAADLSETEVRSGTPMYQAPEQLSGREVTVRSDLYALGLVLYELFTGKRAYVDAGRDTPPSKPSSHVSNLNPAVERVILKCLEPDPSNRPKSGFEVLAGLPGGDPLAAALAAGETPSPQLVADAPVEGTLRPLVAGGLLAITLGGLVLLAAVADRVKAYRHMPLPAPAVLEEYARRHIHDLGYTDKPADSGGGFTNYLPYLRSLVRDGRWTEERELLESARPAAVAYWYRQSPLPMIPGHFADKFRSHELQLWMDNPPSDVPGMVQARVDMRGRLVRLLVVPDSALAPLAESPGWDGLLRTAGLGGPGVLRATAGDLPTPPVYADRTAAWEGAYPERPDVPIRVQAGSYRGRPVFFHISHPSWNPSPSADRDPREPGQVAEIISTVVQTVVLLTLMILAVRNVRHGRGDVRGTVRLAGTIVGLIVLVWIVGGGHVASLPVQFFRFLQNLGNALGAALILAVGYLALEPLMRRRCPHRLTALARLLDGRWRDPLVGRDILIGAALGVVCLADTVAFPFGFTNEGPIVLDSHGFTKPAWCLVLAAALSISMMWGVTSVFLVLSLAVRRDGIAAVLLAAFLAVVSIVPFAVEYGSGWVVPGSLLRLAAVVFLLLRVGVLALMVWSLVAFTTQLMPLTLDTSAWYFGASLTKGLAVVLLAGYGAWISLGGRSPFGKGLFGDD